MTTVMMAPIFVSADSQLVNHTLGGDRQRALDGASASAFVSTAAERFSDLGHVDRSLAPQAYTETPIRLLPEEQRNLNTVDGKSVVDQAFAVFLLRFAALHCSVADVHPRQTAIAMQRVKGSAQQPHLRKLC